jgi:hypothetical protein
MEKRLTEVPQPNESALGVYEVASAIVTSLIPPLAVLKAGTDILIRRRLEHGQSLLLSEIKQNGFSELSNEKWDYYVPAAYRFFEQVRLGEYDHNLKILSKLIAGDLEAENNAPDIGKIGRAAAKLEMLPKGHLFALARCERAFEIYQASGECDGYWICIGGQELMESYEEIGLELRPLDCQEYLHELASRGLLNAGGRPTRVGGTFYYKSSVFNEIINAAKSTVA